MDRIQAINTIALQSVRPIGAQAFQLLVPIVPQTLQQAIFRAQNFPPQPTFLPIAGGTQLGRAATLAANVVNLALIAAGANRNGTAAANRDIVVTVAPGAREAVPPPLETGGTQATNVLLQTEPQTQGTETGRQALNPPGVPPVHLAAARFQQVQRMGEMPPIPLPLRINLAA